MGQKINPKGFRLGQLYNWDSRWFADSRRYKDLLLADVRLREQLFRKLKPAGLARVEIERSINKVSVCLHVAKPGMVIGRGGTGLEELKKYLELFFLSQANLPSGSRSKTSVHNESGRLKIEVSVELVKDPNLDARLVATNVADLLAKRMPHKRVCMQAINRIMAAGAKGVKIALSGRIAGAEIARREKYQEGTIPLSTLREDVDFSVVPSLTKSGYIGVKVWICRRQP